MTPLQRLWAAIVVILGSVALVIAAGMREGQKDMPTATPTGGWVAIESVNEMAVPGGTLQITESFNTTGSIDAIVNDGDDRYLLTRDNAGVLRVVLARKGKPNVTLATLTPTYRVEVAR